MGGEGDGAGLAQNEDIDYNRKKCRYGHSLRFCAEFPYEGSGKRFGRCDECRSVIFQNDKNPAWHCEQCKYDRCKECYGNEDRAIPNVSTKKRKKGKTCPAGHPLQFAGTCEPPKNERKCDGHKCGANVYTDGSPGWQCSQCTYDLCKDCYGNVVGEDRSVDIKFKCTEGHPLLYRSKSPYLGSGRCNQCATSILYNIDDPGWHCKQCHYDVCKPCHGNDKAYNVTSSGEAKMKLPQLMGVYKLSGELHNNFPVYRQDGGPGLAHVDVNGNWVVGEEYESARLYSSKRPINPSPPESQWHYRQYDNSEWDGTDSTLLMFPIDPEMEQEMAGMFGSATQEKDEAKEMKKCTLGHILKNSTRSTAWICNGCHCATNTVSGSTFRGTKSASKNLWWPIPSDAKRYRCQTCNYDLCEDCYISNGKKKHLDCRLRAQGIPSAQLLLAMARAPEDGIVDWRCILCKKRCLETPIFWWCEGIREGCRQPRMCNQCLEAAQTQEETNT